jgi:ribosomal protein L37E
MATREGRWNCPSCGSVGQLGRHVNCMACGAPRPEKIRFYLPEDAEAVTDAEQLAQAGAGPDWICEHCGGSARATDRECPGCGAPRGESAAREVHDYDLAAVPRSGEAGGGSPPPPSTPQPLAAAGAPRESKFGRNVLVVMVLAIFGIFGWANRTRHVEGEIAAKHWERSVQVEAHRWVNDEGWSLPAGARRIRSYRAIRDYRQVLDHYEARTRQVSERVQTGTRTYTCGQIDRGNGYFEDRTCTEPEYETRYHTESYQDPVYRREPIWDTKYEYRIRRWVPDTLLRDQGDGDARRPEWPRVVSDDTTREGEKKSRYQVTFTAPKGKSYTSDVPVEQFNRVRVGEHVPLLVHGTTARLDTATAN